MKSRKPIKPVSKIDLYVIERIKERRIELGMSQAALSYALEVSASYIGQVESDKFPTRYSLDRINDIARILKCKLTDFFPTDPL